MDNNKEEGFKEPLAGYTGQGTTLSLKNLVKIREMDNNKEGKCICLNYLGQNGLCKVEGHKDLFEKYKKEHYNKEEETMVPSSNHCFYGADVRTSSEWKREDPQSPVSEERKRIIDWCKKRMELNKRVYGTDKWNGDMEDLVEYLSGNKE